jgi:uncharacterized membrane protein
LATTDKALSSVETPAAPVAGRPSDNPQPSGSVSRRQGRKHQEAEFRLSTGPLPSPQSLAAYGAVSPDLVNRIVSMAEQQAKHRQTCELTVVKAQTRNATFGIASGLLIGLAGIGAAVVAFYLGHPGAGAVVSVGDLSALVGVFVYGTRARQEPHDKPQNQHHMAELAGRAEQDEATAEEHHHLSGSPPPDVSGASPHGGPPPHRGSNRAPEVAARLADLYAARRWSTGSP